MCLTQPVHSPGVQPPQLHVHHRGVGPRMGHHQVQQRPGAVLRAELPGDEVPPIPRLGQPVEAPVLDQVVISVEPVDLLADLRLLLIRQGRRVQLVAKGTAHGHQGPRAKGSCAPGLLVGANGHMGAHGADGVAERAALLDGEPLDGVGVVAQPDLRRVVQHAGVESPAAAAAPLEQDLREGPGQPLQQIVDPQYVPVAGLPLPLFRQRAAVDVGHIAVHVPLDVVRAALPEQLGEHLPQPIHHFGVRHVQHQLAAPEGGRSSGNGQGPVRVFPVQVAVEADHLRLDPQAELHAHAVDGIRKALQAPGQLLQVGLPVPQPAVVAVAPAEPAVIQHHHLHAKIGRLPGKREQPGLVEVERHRFPVVDQHRAAAMVPAAADDVIADEVMQDARKALQPFRGAAEDDFRGRERLAPLQPPGEHFAVDAADDPHKAQLVHLHIRAVVAAVHRHDADALPLCLRGGGLHQRHEGVVMVAGSPSAAGNGLDAVHQAHPLGDALHAVPPVKVHQFPLPEGDVQTEAGDLFQADRPIAGIAHDHRPGDHVHRFEHAVEQFRLQPCGRVPQGHRQRLGLARSGKGRGQARQGVLPRGHPVPHVPQVDPEDAVVTLAFQRRQAKIARIAARILLRHHVRRKAPCLPLPLGVGGKAPVHGQQQVAQIAVLHPGAVVQVQQVSFRTDLHLIGAGPGAQCQRPGRCVKGNGHVHPSCCAFAPLSSRIFFNSALRSGGISRQFPGLTPKNRLKAFKEPLINSAAHLAVTFAPSTSCKFLNLPPVNPRNLQSYLAQNSLAI